MITGVAIQNFKCFDKISLHLAPLTLLVGFNAAGKSTALQPLLLLAQALQTGINARHLPLNGRLVRLGSPGDVLNEKAGESEIRFGVSFEDLGAEWRFSLDRGGKKSSLAILSRSYRSGRDQIGVPDEPLELFPYVSNDSRLSRMKESLKSLVFISAIRSGTNDLFPIPDDPDLSRGDVGPQGEYAPWWFAGYLDEDICAERRHPGEPALTLRRQLNAWASELFPGVDANAMLIPKTNFARVEMRTRTTEDYRRPVNIGYGLTYAFPILVAALTAERGQTLVVDSPEAHLHPRAQSAMGRILATFAASGLQVVLETHSDHVLNGVRLATARKYIPAASIAIHFFNEKVARDNGLAHITSPSLDESGKLSEWPEGFFDQAERDMSLLAGWR